MPTPAATLLVYLQMAVDGNGDSLAANPSFKVALDLLRQRYKTEGEGIHDDALAAFTDAAQGRTVLLSLLGSCS